MKFAGKSRNDWDDDDVVEDGDKGVNVNDDDEQVEFVGLGHILGEFGGGNKSLSGCCIGLKCLLSMTLVFDDEEEDKDGAIEDRRLSDCWVASKFVLESIKPHDRDSLKKRNLRLAFALIKIIVYVNQRILDLVLDLQWV